MGQEEASPLSNNLDSSNYDINSTPVERSSGWLRLGTVAAASALAGGLAAAWWYRKTLTKLRESGESSENTQFGILDDPPSDQEPPFEA